MLSYYATAAAMVESAGSPDKAKLKKLNQLSKNLSFTTSLHTSAKDPSTFGTAVRLFNKLGKWGRKVIRFPRSHLKANGGIAPESSTMGFKTTFRSLHSCRAFTPPYCLITFSNCPAPTVNLKDPCATPKQYEINRTPKSEIAYFGGMHYPSVIFLIFHTVTLSSHL